MTQIILISCAFILGGIFGVIIGNFMRRNMAYTCCLENLYISKTLSRCKRNDLAVIDTDGISTAAIKAACARGVQVCGYISAI